MLDFSALNDAWSRWQFQSGANARRRIYIKLAKLLENGVKIMDGIQTMRDRRFRSHGKSDPIVMAFDVWMKQLRNGRKFSDAIQGWVPAQERMLIAAGERSGKLGEALLSSGRVMIAQKNIRNAIISGTLYPVLLIVAVIGMLFLFGYKLIPAFGRLVPEDKWTGLASAVVSLSGWVQDWLWLPVMGLLIAIGVLLWALPNWTGSGRAKFDQYPPFSVYRLIHGSSWIISLSAMVEAGERLEDALNIIGKDAAPWMASRNGLILKGLRSGHNLGEAMAKTNTQFPDPDIIDDMAVYAITSGLDQALRQVSTEWIDDSVAAIKTKMQFLFYVGIVVAGSVIGFMVAGLISMQLQMGPILQNGVA